MPNQLKCQLCQKQISGKYYSLWKITKEEWDKIPLGEKETRKIFNYHLSCYEENASEEILKNKILNIKKLKLLLLSQKKQFNLKFLTKLLEEKEQNTLLFQLKLFRLVFSL